MLKFMIMLLALSIDLVIVRYMAMAEYVEEEIEEEIEFFFNDSSE